MPDLVFLEPNKIGAEVPMQKPMHQVYVIEQRPNFCKVGVSSEFKRRKRTIETQGGFDAIRSYSSAKVSNGGETEREAHRLLPHYRDTGEWFAIPFEFAVCAVKKAIRSVGNRRKRFYNTHDIQFYPGIPAKGEAFTRWFLDDSPGLLKWFLKNHYSLYFDEKSSKVFVKSEDGEFEDVTFELFAAITLYA